MQLEAPRAVCQRRDVDQCGSWHEFGAIQRIHGGVGYDCMSVRIFMRCCTRRVSASAQAQLSACTYADTEVGGIFQQGTPMPEHSFLDEIRCTGCPAQRLHADSGIKPELN
eukprot:scaffold24788_cov22-Tisochrysis_lutea.AAC.4